MYWFVGIVGGLALFTLITAFVCFYLVFYAKARRPLGPDEYAVPPGKIYEPFREEMIGWAKEVRAMPSTEMTVTSLDGLTLRGRYYECKKGAVTEILFHGYRGDAERDMSGAVHRCFAIGHNVILVDQRACGRSDGHVITFGIRERHDAVLWAKEAVRLLGSDARLMLSGVSMGAATVMMAAGEELVPNVGCILADCGYSSPKEIIQKVMRDMGVPVGLLYPFVRWGARLFGGFDPEEATPMEALQKNKIPVILFHGDADDFVPHSMSERLYEACAAEQKAFISVEGAGHGLAFSVSKEAYLRALADFCEKIGL